MTKREFIICLSITVIAVSFVAILSSGKFSSYGKYSFRKLDIYSFRTPSIFGLCLPGMKKSYAQRYGEEFCRIPYRIKCPLGMKSAEDPFFNNKKFCYTPSGYEGNPCNRRGDCGSGKCILNYPFRKAKCVDADLLCEERFDKEGNVLESICVVF